MGKLTGALKIKGKLKSADIVFVEGRNGIHTRSLPKLKTVKTESFQRNADSASTVSALAGQVNRIFKQYAPADTGRRMYTGLLRHMRRMNTVNRFTLLHGLIGLNGHSVKTMGSLEMYQRVEKKLEGRRLTASITYTKHARLEKDVKYYRLEFIVVQWNSGTDEPVGLEQHSKWIAPGDKIKAYDFVFDLSEHCSDWLLLLRCRLGEEKGTKRLPPTDVVLVTDAGSFDEASLKAFEEYHVAKKAAAAIEPNDFSEEDDGVEGREV